MKICNACGITKEPTQFCKDKNKKDGLHGSCRICSSFRNKQWYSNDKNATTVRNRAKQYYETNKEEVKQYYLGRKPIKKLYMKNWRKENKANILKYKRTYESDKKKSNVGYRMLCNIRNRITLALKNNTKSNSTKILLGCTIEELKKHLESLFTEGMSWDNYGVKGWHIDHKVPCASFDLSKVTEQQRCFHYTNLQPLWHEDNIKKSDKLIYPS